MKLNIQMFAISGTGKAKRNSYKVFMDFTEGEVEDYELIGKDLEELNRTLNNNVDSKTNILGETEVEITKGNQVTTVDPVKFRRDSKITAKMYEIYQEDLELDDVVFPFMEVNTEDLVSAGEYKAFKQKGAVDLKSYGGDAKTLSTPFDINWVGEKTFGTFNPTTKKFTVTPTV